MINASEISNQAIINCLYEKTPSSSDARYFLDICKNRGRYQLDEHQIDKLAKGAQRLCYIFPHANEVSIEARVIALSMAHYLPEDLRIIDDRKKILSVNSLVLRNSSQFFEAMFGNASTESTRLQEKWQESTDQVDAIEIRSPFPIKSIEVLLGSYKHPTRRLMLGLVGLEPTKRSAFEVNSIAKRMFTTMTIGINENNVLKRFQTFSDLLCSYSFCEIGKVKCIDYLIHKVRSLKAWNDLEKDLDDDIAKNLLDCGFQRHVDFLSKKSLRSKDLFKTLDCPGSADVLVHRWNKKLKANDEQWLAQWEKLVPTITDFKYFNVSGLDSTHIEQILDRIASHATYINFSGYGDSYDIFSKEYPKLEGLDISHSNFSIISTASGKLPKLTTLNVSHSAELQEFYLCSPESLTNVNMRHCPQWQDAYFLMRNAHSFNQLDVVGCSDDFVQTAYALLPRNVILITR